ncbi:NADH dehydrogenase [ubiquinone] 1 beta subcomplex subunit 10-B, partial [Cucurbita argyrosperma subsp. sororia]
MGRKKTVEFDESPPDDFDAEHPYKDPVAMLEMREHIESTIFRNAATLFSNTLIPLAASVGARMDATHLFMVLKWRRSKLSKFLGGITRLNKRTMNISPLFYFVYCYEGCKEF